MPVLVTGATGVVGRALVPRLVSTGGQVRVYVRRDVPEYRALGVKVAVGDADHEGRLESALEQVHTIVHLIGGPVPAEGASVEWLNLETTQVALRAAENAEVQRFLFLSPVGADPAESNPYLAAKGRAEEAIGASRLEHVIFRCAPILGRKSALERALGGRTVGSGSQRLNPIAVADVVNALVSADDRDAELGGVWELGGPEVVTFGDFARRARDAGVARVGLFSGRSKALGDLFARDSIADSAPAVKQFVLTLTPLAEALEAFRS